MMIPTIKIDGKSVKVFGMYGSESAAKKRLLLEEQHGGFGKFGIRKLYVGKSVDPGYSDSEGYSHVIYWK